MSNLAQLLESLPPDYQREAANYLQYLKQRSEAERARFLAAIAEGEADIAAGRVHDDDEVWRMMEARFGPLDDSIEE